MICGAISGVEKMLLLPDFLHLPKKRKFAQQHIAFLYFSGLITKMVINLQTQFLVVASKAIDAIKIASLIS